MSHSLQNLEFFVLNSEETEMAKIIPEYKLEIIKIPLACTVNNNYVSIAFNILLQTANFMGVTHSVPQVTMLI